MVKVKKRKTSNRQPLRGYPRLLTVFLLKKTKRLNSNIRHLRSNQSSLNTQKKELSERTQRRLKREKRIRKLESNLQRDH